jgi:SAM-dependent methyltransferase
MLDCLGLNIACGDTTMPDDDMPVARIGYVSCDIRWINMDLRSGDVLGDARSLPFAPESFCEVLAQDILEHFPIYRTVDILQEWRRVLTVGGRLALRVPNLAWMGRALATSTDHQFLTDVIENLYGGHRWGPDGAWDAHHTGWTPQMMKDLLEANGFGILTQDGNNNFYTVAIKR